MDGCLDGQRLATSRAACQDPKRQAQVKCQCLTLPVIQPHIAVELQ
jgi:hypothetical protein